jgi:hypothetical protein
VLALAGCGGGSSSSSGSSSTPNQTAGNSKEFISPGGENEYAKFGEEASGPERQAASKVLEENLQARQAGEWDVQCSSLTEELIEELAPNPGIESPIKACAEALERFARPLKKTAGIRRDNLVGEIDVLRVEGNHAFALFHGPKGKDYAMRMAKEDGDWKVAGIVTSEIN